MKLFKTYADAFGNDGTFAITQSDEVFIRILQPDTEVTITVPTDAKFALFQSDQCDIWAKFGGTTAITVPTADADSQELMYNPEMRFIENDEILRVISGSTGTLVVSFYG